MQNKTILSLVAIVVVAGISTGFIANDNHNAVSSIVHVDGSLPAFTVEELSKGSTHAIIGEVKTITPVIVERENRKYVFSDVVLSVEQDLFGTYDEKQITVRIMGGQVDNLKTETEDEASFRLNERTLVFVAGPEPGSIWKDSYYVAGLVHGKYNLSDGNASKDESSSSISESELVSKIQTFRGI